MTTNTQKTVKEKTTTTYVPPEMMALVEKMYNRERLLKRLCLFRLWKLTKRVFRWLF